jgi:hypothetical protein
VQQAQKKKGARNRMELIAKALEGIRAEYDKEYKKGLPEGQPNEFKMGYLLGIKRAIEIIENNTNASNDKCKVIDSDYCKNECPLCRLGPDN